MDENRVIIAAQLVDYCKYLESEERSPATIQKYLRDVRAFLVFAGKRAVTKELVITYKNYLIESSYMPASINSMLAALNNFFAFMNWTDCRVKNLRTQRKAYCPEERELTRAEYMRLLHAARDDPRLHLVLQTICGTGIRISELKHFTIEAVKAGQVTVQCKNKIRIVLIPEKLQKKLLLHAKKRGIPSGPVFITRCGNPLDRSNIWKQMKRFCRMAGIDPRKVFPHNLRKLFAREFYAIERDIAKLADILGHSSIDTTRIYIMTTGIEHRKQMEQMGLVT